MLWPSRFLSAGVALLFMATASAQFTDDFSDGDFTNNPAWSGNTDKFIVDNGQLRSNAGQGAATYHLSTPSSQVQGQWEFFVNLKFSPSSANFVDIYLTSDAQDLNPGANGYAVRIGEVAKRITLYRMNGATTTPLALSPDGVVNSSTNNPVRVKVTRDAANLWTLYYQTGTQGSYTLAGTATDASITTSSWFGVRIVQSTAASPVNNHFFDDFYVGPIILDTTPAQIVSATIADAQHVDLLFNEPVAQASAEDVSNYDVVPFNGVAAAALDGLDPALVRLTLQSPMQNLNTYTLLVNGVEDLAGNAIANGTASFTYLVFSEAQPGDVVINELLPDPDPVVGLPNAEFVELYNATNDKAFDLTGWKIFAGTSSGTLPNVQLLPGEYVILSGTSSAAQFAAFGHAVGVPSFPALVNAGDAMNLKKPDGTSIDAVTYDLSWYNDAVKANGGWTLERKDPYTPCSDRLNWTSSVAVQGGTPGAVNSVFALQHDTVPPALQQLFVIDASTLDLVFNELMDAASLMAGSYTLEPFLGVASVEVMDTKRVRLHLTGPLVEGQMYQLTVLGVADCPGNPIGGANALSFALPQPLAKGDVIINEVLYDPRGTGSDFVELYNRSQKVVSLQGLKLANVSNGAVANAKVITPDPYLLLPGQYVAVAADVANVLMNYPLGRADRMLQASLPSYPNGGGTVVFLGVAGDTLDWFVYSDAMHFPLLKSVDGVSLERVDPDRPTDDPGNWHSAAAAVNFATPGYQNSQYAPAPEPRGNMTIEPAIFSPDNDGYQDLLTITYAFDEPGFVATMKVFDLAGREVRTLMNNELLGTGGAVTWDGMMDTNELARVGPYVVYMEAYDLAGNVEKYRKTVVLAHRL